MEVVFRNFELYRRFAERVLDAGPELLGRRIFPYTSRPQHADKPVSRIEYEIRSILHAAKEVVDFLPSAVAVSFEVPECQMDVETEYGSVLVEVTRDDDVGQIHRLLGIVGRHKE